jgi:PAT family beta-lactamase induction signal transducer AmpG
MESLIQSLRIYTKIRVIRMLFLGFSAGLPLLLLLGTLSFRLREAGLDLALIGFFSWIGLTYAFKWAWAPLVDQLPVPLLTKALGRRRSWLVCSQLLVIFGLSGLAFSDPSISITAVIWFSLLTAIGSATQDIALDAFRIESAGTEDQGAMAATYQIGYRVAMLVASAGALFLADLFSSNSSGYDDTAWSVSYLIMAGLMLIGVITALLSPEPRVPSTSEEEIKLTNRASPLLRLKRWLVNAGIMPFVDFVKRYKRQAILILIMISIYRISDVVMGVMANPFYVDIGFSKQEIATVTKLFGVIMTLLGAVIGGVFVKHFGALRMLIIGAMLTSSTNLLFAWLSNIGANIPALVLTISADNLSAGLATAAFVSYLSGLTNIKYSATQYALFSSVMLLIPKFLAGWSGVFVEELGYENFFLFSAALGIPVILLLLMLYRDGIKTA